MKRLNLGCGSLKIEGYENIDITGGQDAASLNCPDASIDEIRASHLLEHFPYERVFDVVKHWVSKLKTGGILKIAVPDFKKICKGYLNGSQDKTCMYIMGGQVDENDYHKCIFDESSLRQIMEAAGLSDIKGWNDKQDTCRLDISLNLMGTKKTKQSVKRNIGCVISQPRLGFTHNANCMIKELAMRGIECTVGTGAYWHQVLTNIMEQELAKDIDYLLTLDYDTWFKFGHVKKMMELMEVSDADAIVTNQVKRENDELLLRSGKSTMSRGEYKDNLMPITSGHFGCTLFRAESFKKLPKPWFLPKPGPDGSWKDGRVDADIYFWQNFIDSGLRVYVAPQLRIGHMQIMCTFAGEFENSFKPVHLYMNEIEKGELPEFVKKGFEDED